VLKPFALHRPRTIQEGCELLAGLGEDAVPYAGGTELLLLMKEGLLRPRHLVDVKRIAGLGTIDGDGDRLRIGATVTHRMLERSERIRGRWPVVAAVARHVANVRVRNVGTVGGNLAFADPHSDLATLFLALDASVEMASPRGRRELAIGDFICGPWDTVREADELLVSVNLGPESAGTVATYVKFGLHERPTLGIAAALRLDGRRITDARIAVGCVNPRPVRLAEVEGRLRGGNVTDLEALDRELGELASSGVDPADDLHGSADYKREMVGVFARRALRALAARATGVEAVARFPHAVVA
jgi:aerobic carbon-monoxide dehydrogenase medium subunit